MTKIKKAALSVLSLLTVAFCAFGVAACGDDDYDGSYGGNSGQGGGNRTGTEVTVGEEFSVKSEGTQNYEWYYFTLENDGYISLDFKHPVLTTDSTRWKMELYMEDMSTRYSDDKNVRWDIKGNENLTTPNMGVSAGTYYIKVIDGNKLWNGELVDANVTVNYTAANNWETENNGKAEKANEIQTGVPRYGTSIVTGDWDWYKFTVEEDGYVSLDFKHEVVATNDTRWQLEFYMADASTVYSNNSDVYWSIAGNADFTTPNMGIAAGTYYVKVVGGRRSYWGTEPVDYNLTVNYTAANNWETENNGKAEKANEIQTGVPRYGTSIVTGDWDWYKFTVEEDGYVSLDFKHEVVATNDTRWQLEFYMADASTVYSNNSDVYWSIAGNADFTTPNMGIAAGTYYVKVVGGRRSYWGTEPVDYNLTVNYTAANNWEKEYNGKAEKANEIAVNTPYYGTSIVTGDWDWYKFTLEEDGYITIDFKHEVTTQTSQCWVFELYEVDATSLYGQSSSWSVKGTENFATTQIGMEAGTYYIKVIGGRRSYWGTQPVDYNIQVNFADAGNWETEDNNSFSVATEIDFWQTWNGTIISENDDDWYVFTADGYKYLNLSFYHETLGTSSTCWKVKIYAADATTEIAAMDVKGDDIASTLTFGVNAGTYYVKVTKGSYNIWQGGYNGSSTPYSFHIDEVV